jgi:hypothetical protein
LKYLNKLENNWTFADQGFSEKSDENKKENQIEDYL